MLSTAEIIDIAEAEYSDIIDIQFQIGPQYIVGNHENIPLFTREASFSPPTATCRLVLVHRELELYLHKPVNFEYAWTAICANKESLRKYFDYVRMLNTQARAKLARIKQNKEINALLNAAK